MAKLTISDAARRCGVDRRTLQRAIRTGRLTLTADHRLTPEALAQAGYAQQGDAAGTPQGQMSHLLPQVNAASMPQDAPQELAQATALLALLERLTSAITALHEEMSALHEEVGALRDDLRQMPQWRRGRRRRVP